jgi:hypothetical protein
MTDKSKSLALVVAHVLAITIAVATAISALGTDKLAALFSKDPIQVIGAACALVVAVGAAVGAGAAGSFKNPPATP